MDEKQISDNLAKMYEYLVETSQPLTLIQLSVGSGVPELEALEALNSEENKCITSLINTKPLDGRNPPEIHFVPMEILHD